MQEFIQKNKELLKATISVVVGILAFAASHYAPERYQEFLVLIVGGLETIALAWIGASYVTRKVGERVEYTMNRYSRMFKK